MCTETETKNSEEKKNKEKNQVIQFTDKPYLELNNVLSVSQELLP